MSELKDLLEKSLNNYDTYNNIGYLYLYGKGVTRDYLKAKECFEKASAMNNYDAYNNLGYLYLYGLGVKHDYLKAREYFEKACEINNSYGYNNIGDSYYYGLGTPIDYLKAKKYYLKAVELKSSDGFYNMGNLYYYGHGVTKDVATAKKYYLKAIDNNNVRAHKAFADIYLKENNIVEAAIHYNKASNLDSADATLIMNNNVFIKELALMAEEKKLLNKRITNMQKLALHDSAVGMCDIVIAVAQQYL